MPYDRRRSSQHPIEIHSMDHLASLTSLSHFLPITYVTFRRKVQPFFSQFEYIVPSADIHMYTRPILSAFPPLAPKRSFLVSPYLPPPLFLSSLSFARDSLSRIYRSFYLANPMGWFCCSLTEFFFLSFFPPFHPALHRVAPHNASDFDLYDATDSSNQRITGERLGYRGMRRNYKFMLPACV